MTGDEFAFRRDLIVALRANVAAMVAISTS
jgi:hypothetical protein